MHNITEIMNAFASNHNNKRKFQFLWVKFVKILYHRLFWQFITTFYEISDTHYLWSLILLSHLKRCSKSDNNGPCRSNATNFPLFPPATVKVPQIKLRAPFRSEYKCLGSFLFARRFSGSLIRSEFITVIYFWGRTRKVIARQSSQLSHKNRRALAVCVCMCDKNRSGGRTQAERPYIYSPRVRERRACEIGFERDAAAAETAQGINRS